MGAEDTDTELGTEQKAMNKTGKISVLIERPFQAGRQKMDSKWEVSKGDFIYCPRMTLPLVTIILLLSPAASCPFWHSERYK